MIIKVDEKPELVLDDIKSGDLVKIEYSSTFIYKEVDGLHLLIDLDGNASIGVSTQYTTKEKLFTGMPIKEHYSKTEWLLKLERMEN